MSYVDQCKHIQTDVLIYVKTFIYFFVPALSYIGFKCFIRNIFCVIRAYTYMFDEAILYATAIIAIAVAATAMV